MKLTVEESKGINGIYLDLNMLAHIYRNGQAYMDGWSSKGYTYADANMY